MKIKVTIIIPVYNQEKLVVRALDSIPERDDIEILVIDDGSTDDTWNVLMNYRRITSKNIAILYNDINMGVSYSINKGIELATGEYIVLLGSDDYFYTDSFIKCLDLLDGTDIVYFDLQTNDGTIFHLSDETKYGYCGSVKSIRKEFIGNIRNKEDVKFGEDYFFYHEIMQNNPTEKFSNIIAKHYNFPRSNSLYDLGKRGLIK